MQKIIDDANVRYGLLKPRGHTITVEPKAIPKEIPIHVFKKPRLGEICKSDSETIPEAANRWLFFNWMLKYGTMGQCETTKAFVYAVQAMVAATDRICCSKPMNSVDKGLNIAVHCGLEDTMIAAASELKEIWPDFAGEIIDNEGEPDLRFRRALSVLRDPNGFEKQMEENGDDPDEAFSELGISKEDLEELRKLHEHSYFLKQCGDEQGDEGCSSKSMPAGEGNKKRKRD